MSEQQIVNVLSDTVPRQPILERLEEVERAIESMREGIIQEVLQPTPDDIKIRLYKGQLIKKEGELVGLQKALGTYVEVYGVV
jgi:hypothetical protein